MAYIGNIPADKYQTLQKQSFTTSATDTYTLSYAVTNPQDLALFINNVRQNPNDAYTVSNTTLTLSSAITSSDTMYAVFLGRAVETVAPAIGSVTNSMLANSSITLNGSAVSLGGSATVGGSNTPAFFINKQSDQTLSSATYTLITFDTEIIDTDNAFASNKFTVPSGKGGKYVIGSVLLTDANAGSNYEYSIIQMRVNGATTHHHITDFRLNNATEISIPVQAIFDLSAGDYVEVYCQISDYSGSPTIDTDGSTFQSYFYGYRLIGA